MKVVLALQWLATPFISKDVKLAERKISFLSVNGQFGKEIRHS